MNEVFGTRSYFQAADYVVCSVIILASLAIGVYYGLRGGGQRTSNEYILANRSMGLVPVTLSLLASFFSGISLQGYPADVYFHGPMVLWIAVPILIGGVLSVKFFMPMFYRLGMASAYEYLQLRFNYAVKICGVFSYLFFLVFYSALVTYTACVAATAVTGIRVEIAIVGLCVVCAIYTVLGGIKAVLWTDSLQMLLMIATTLAIIIKTSMELGFGDLWEIASDGGRTNFFDFHSDLTDFYNGWAFMSQLSFLGITVSNQYMVQRLVICKSEAVARASLICYCVGTVTFQALLVLAGISVYAYYAGCDPSTLGYTTKPDQIVPYFIVDVFGVLPGVPGLLLTGLFGAALSTLSSVFNASATLIGEHFVKPFLKTMKDSTYTFILKIIVFVSSLVTLGTAFLVPLIGAAIPMVLTVGGCSISCLFALYIIGAFFPFCGPKGAVWGFVAGMGVGVVLSVGCIVYQTPSENLPLSADMCLNDTFPYLNDTALVAASTLAAPLSGSSATQMTIPTDTPSSRPEIPVIFTLSKSWLSLLTFVVTVVAALFATLITGKNDTSNLDPRLVIWKIKSTYVPDGMPVKVGKYSTVPKTDESEENNEIVKSKPKAVAMYNEYTAMEKVTTV